MYDLNLVIWSSFDNQCSSSLSIECTSLIIQCNVCESCSVSRIMSNLLLFATLLHNWLIHVKALHLSSHDAHESLWCYWLKWDENAKGYNNLTMYTRMFQGSHHQCPFVCLCFSLVAFHVHCVTEPIWSNHIVTSWKLNYGHTPSRFVFVTIPSS
jgi:hypothetical protein